MDVNDLLKFSEWFDVLAITHGKHFPNEDIRSRTRAEYFDVLRPYPLDAVLFAYENLRRRMKKWPVPADWLENLPPANGAGRLAVATFEEAHAWDEAQRLGFEAKDFCQCDRCVRANATHLKPRHLTRRDANGQDLIRRHPTRPAEFVELGFWLHGAELKAWYAARARFYEALAALESEGGRKKGTRDQRLEQLNAVAQSALRAV